MHMLNIRGLKISETMKYLKKCFKCGIYTLKDKCPKCGEKTKSAYPVKFDPNDKYGKYRRLEKYGDINEKNKDN